MSMAKLLWHGCESGRGFSSGQGYVETEMVAQGEIPTTSTSCLAWKDCG